MRRPRLAAAILFGAGVLTGTANDATPHAAPALIDGYYVLAADFHVHTAFGDGGLAPWDARREAGRRGLDVIAVTNHNQTFAGRLHRRLFGDDALPLLLIGQEVTAPHHHILAVGISNAVDWNQSAAATIDAIHARGGIAIAAHPSAKSARDFDQPALERLDGVEVAHPGTVHGQNAIEFAAFFERARRANPRVARIGDSDFHFTGDIGVCRTFLLAREASEAGVLDAVRNGRTVAYDSEGTAYGEPAMVDLVERARRARESGGGTRLRAHADSAGAAMAWLGLAGLVMLGPAPRRRE